MFRNNPQKVQFCRCVRHDDEPQVRPHQAYTPAEVADLVAQGKPISTQNVALTYNEGVTGENWDFDLSVRRGVDINDLWNAYENEKKQRNRFSVVNVEGGQNA